MPWCLAAMLALTVIAIAPRASAQEELDPASAALFHEGRALIKKGDWVAGCERIEASTKRIAAVSALLNLALCREHDGRVASAWVIARRALLLNKETQGRQRREGLDASGLEIVGRLEPRLPKLRVSVAPKLEGARVDEGGLEVPLDTSVPLDPGEHELVLTAPGRSSVRRKVQLREGEVLSVEMAFPAASSDPSPPLDEASASPPSSTPAPIVEQEEDPGAAPLPVWVWVVGSAGVALGGVSIAFAVDSANAAADLEERCGPDLVCDEDPSFDPEPDNARKNRGLGLAIGLGAGSVAALTAAIAGAAIAAGAPSQKSSTVSFGVSGWGGPDGAGAMVSGRF